jgi:hypothetical protein
MIAAPPSAIPGAAAIANACRTAGWTARDPKIWELYTKLIGTIIPKFCSVKGRKAYLGI